MDRTIENAITIPANTELRGGQGTDAQWYSFETEVAATVIKLLADGTKIVTLPDHPQLGELYLNQPVPHEK